MQSQLWPAYILHSRPFQENKLLLQLLLPDYGRVSAVIRKQQGKLRYALQPFQLFAVELSGRSELKTIKTLDELAPALLLQGRILFSALYLNELICRLWPDNLGAEQLFLLYQQSLQQLSLLQPDSVELEPCLREFEFSLLQELGLPVDWQYDGDGQTLRNHLSYRWLPEHGFIVAAQGWSGADLSLIGRRQWQKTSTRQVAKQLSRQLLAPLLGDKPLASRALFSGY